MIAPMTTIMMILQYLPFSTMTGVFHWRTLTSNMIINWERQAAYLNTRPKPGLLATFPHANSPRQHYTLIGVDIANHREQLSSHF